jgi:energy-coupling factor transporter transmembrane protein EcfT
LLRALRSLGAPRWFVTIAAMAYRYLSVLVQASLDLFEARQSRTLGRTTTKQGRQFVGSAIGGLFGKTVALTEEVHAAMESRGWSGEAVALGVMRVRPLDAAWAVAMGVVATIALGGEFLG